MGDGRRRGLLQRAIEGTVRWSPWWVPLASAKDRLVREVAALAAARGSRCSRPVRIPHRPGALPRRGVCCDRPPAPSILTPNKPGHGCGELDPDADPDDVLLFEDLVGVADPETGVTQH